MRILKSKKGFTLAEALITLTMLGLIAALTVPTLKKNTERKEFAAKISKTYSSLAQATKILSEEAAIRFWDITFVDSESQDCYSKRLSYLTKEGSGGDVKFYMNDGQTIEVKDFGKKLESATFGADKDDKLYGYFIVDVNGKTKPNEYGYDKYVLVLVDGKGLLPSGYSNCSGDTYGCGASVIQVGKSKL